MLGGYEVMVSAIGGLLVGACCMLWALAHDKDLDAGALFDKLFSLLRALLLIRAAGDGTAALLMKQKTRIKRRVQKLQARLRELEGTT